MAIYHFSVKIIGRGRGRKARDQSAIASAAYRCGTPLTDRATGKVKNYPRRAPRVIWSAIFAPVGAPAWAKDREALWNKVEQTENRRNSAFCREIEFSLPAELTDQQRVWLVTDFIREMFCRHGLIADVAIHAPDGDSDDRNFHCHALIVERPIVNGDFARHKNRDLQKRETLRHWRAEWSAIANRALARHGYSARIDHRSLLAQGMVREPTKHLGHVACEIERRGGASYRGNKVRAIKARNARRLMEATKLSGVINDALRATSQPRTEPPAAAEVEYDSKKSLVSVTDQWGVGIISRSP